MRHRIVLNRACCGRCGDELVSRPPHEAVVCTCGYLAIDGGRVQRIRRCMDLPGDDAIMRDFLDTSTLTATFIREGGLIVEAFVSEIAVNVVGPDGRRSLAEPGDWVVFEPEGGHTAWLDETFLARHVRSLR